MATLNYCLDSVYELSPSNSPSRNEDILVLPYPKHDILVSGWLLSHPQVDIKDINVWQHINSLVCEHWNYNFGAKEWQMRWIYQLDQTLVAEHHLHANEDLPVIGNNDSVDVRLEKACVRLAEFQRQYAKICSPLALAFVTCNNEEVCLQAAPCKCRGRLFAKCDPLSLEFVRRTEENMTHGFVATGGETDDTLAFNSSDFGVKENLFHGMQFYLPHSSNMVSEINRWKVEMLIWVYGGTCNLRESDIKTKNAIVLATGDETKNMWKIARWYDCKIYKPSVIEDCVTEGKSLDADMLAQNEWYSQCRR